MPSGEGKNSADDGGLTALKNNKPVGLFQIEACGLLLLRSMVFT